MSGLALALRQVRYENKSFWRNPPAAFFTFFFPLIFLVLFTLLFGDDPIELPDGSSMPISTYYVAAIIAFAVVNACYSNLATSLPFSRDEGILKRVRGTPLPPWSFLVGKIAHAILMMILLVVIVIAFGALLYDADLPTENIGGFILSVVVGAAAFCALGVATTALIPNAEAAPAIVNAIILPLLFISGIFIPLGQAPDWLTSVAGIFPVKPFAEATIFSYVAESEEPFELFDVLVVALWGLAGLVLATRFFSWEPRR